MIENDVVGLIKDELIKDISMSSLGWEASREH